MVRVKGRLGPLTIGPNPATHWDVQAHDLTQEGDEFACEGSPGWLPLFPEDVGQTPAKLFSKYAEDGFRGLRIRRAITLYDS